jgi:hypothetical protein
LLAPDWREQLKLSAQVFAPWVEADFNDLGSVPARGVIDWITGVLIWVSVAAGILFFWRGYRSLFVGWFIGGAVVGSLLLSNWSAWKLTGWIPPALVLIGFLADDLLALLKRVDRRAAVAGSLVLVVVVGWVATLNVRTLRANADDATILREWSNTPSQMFSACDHLRRRPDDNVAIVSQRVKNPSGFTTPPRSDAEERAAWGDYRFVCWGLRGMSVADVQEVWPVFVDGNRPITLLAIVGPWEGAQVVDTLAHAMPELGEPDVNKDAPGGLFTTLAYDTTAAEVNARRGLIFRRGDEERVVEGPRFAPPEDGSGPYTLSGMVLAPTGMRASLQPMTQTTEGAPPVRIRVDGQPSYDPAAGATPRDILAGWHMVEVEFDGTDTRPLELAWRVDDTTVTTTTRDDFFALADTNVWTHERTFSPAMPDAPEFTATRFDFAPHYAIFDGLRINGRNPLPHGTRVAQERWKARWTLDGGVYIVSVANVPGPFEMLVDGQVRLQSAGAADAVTATFDMAAGDHMVEMIFTAGERHYIGGLLSITDAGGAPVEVEINPY